MLAGFHMMLVKSESNEESHGTTQCMMRVIMLMAHLLGDHFGPPRSSPTHGNEQAQQHSGCGGEALLFFFLLL